MQSVQNWSVIIVPTKDLDLKRRHHSNVMLQDYVGLPCHLAGWTQAEPLRDKLHPSSSLRIPSSVHSFPPPAPSQCPLNKLSIPKLSLKGIFSFPPAFLTCHGMCKGSNLCHNLSQGTLPLVLGEAGRVGVKLASLKNKTKQKTLLVHPLQFPWAEVLGFPTHAHCLVEKAWSTLLQMIWSFFCYKNKDPTDNSSSCPCNG